MTLFPGKPPIFCYVCAREVTSAYMAHVYLCSTDCEASWVAIQVLNGGGKDPNYMDHTLLARARSPIGECLLALRCWIR